MFVLVFATFKEYIQYVLLETDCNSYSNLALSKQMLLGGQVHATGNFVFIDSTLVMAINSVALAVRRRNS